MASDLKFEPGFQSLRTIHKALGLPESIGLVSFAMDCRVDSIARAKVEMILTEDQMYNLGILLGDYELTPRNKQEDQV